VPRRGREPGGIVPALAEMFALSGAAGERGVIFVKGTDFGGDPHSLRLAYSFVSADEIAEGVARLAAAIPVTA